MVTTVIRGIVSNVSPTVQKKTVVIFLQMFDNLVLKKDDFFYKDKANFNGT